MHTVRVMLLILSYVCTEVFSLSSWPYRYFTGGKVIEGTEQEQQQTTEIGKSNSSPC